MKSAFFTVALAALCTLGATSAYAENADGSASSRSDEQAAAAIEAARSEGYERGYSHGARIATKRVKEELVRSLYLACLRRDANTDEIKRWNNLPYLGAYKGICVDSVEGKVVALSLFFRRRLPTSEEIADFESKVRDNPDFDLVNAFSQ